MANDLTAPPQAKTGRTRILLSEAVSRHLIETGESAFIVIGKASWPDDPKRWALHLVPASVAQVNALLAVIRDEARVVRKSPQKSPRLATSHPRAKEGHSSTTDQSQYLQ